MMEQTKAAVPTEQEKRAAALLENKLSEEITYDEYGNAELSDDAPKIIAQALADHAAETREAATLPLQKRIDELEMLLRNAHEHISDRRNSSPF